jgi:DNA polymerase-3 subunit alpha
MHGVEDLGLLKMDFLGLRNLSVLDYTVKLIKRTRGIEIDPMKFPLDDPETYKLLQRGDGKGVFQLESEGIRELLKQMKPDNIRDLIAVLALYRPGPLSGGMVDSYVNRKHGRETWEYPHPVLKDILDETYGVMVYQEQIMRILNRLGGIELSKSYACIKAISKKDEEKINSTRADFVTGCISQGVSKAIAEDIFDKIVFFADYGFNKSHTTAYAQIAFQTAYLKTHFTAEFMSALLTSEIEDSAKRDVMVDHIVDARKLGVEVQPPNVNTGNVGFDVMNGKIVFGLTAIKGVGKGSVEEIVRARNEAGPFRDLFDFCERVDLRIVKPMAIEKLVKAGAFDCFGKGKRAATLLASMRAVSAAEDKAVDKRLGQKNIFEMMGGDDDSDVAPVQEALENVLPECDEWNDLDTLKYEKEVLDFYISSHPLAHYDEQLRRFRTHDAVSLIKAKDRTEGRIAGMIVNLGVKSTKTGKRFAIFRVEDFTGSVKCILWSDEFARFQEQVVNDGIAIFEGTLSWGDRTEPVFIVRRVLSIEEAKKEFTRGLVLRMNYQEEDDGRRQFEAVAHVLNKTKGNCPVYVTVRDKTGLAAQFKLNVEFSVNPKDIGVEELEMILGKGAVFFVGR